VKIPFIDCVTNKEVLKSVNNRALFGDVKSHIGLATSRRHTFLQHFPEFSRHQ